MPRHSTAHALPLRTRMTAVRLSEAVAPTSLEVDDRVYLAGEPACVGVVVGHKPTGEVVVEFGLGRSEVPVFLLRRAEV